MNRRNLISASRVAGVVLAASVAPDVARVDDTLSALDRILRDKTDLPAGGADVFRDLLADTVAVIAAERRLDVGRRASDRIAQPT